MLSVRSYLARGDSALAVAERGEAKPVAAEALRSGCRSSDRSGRSGPRIQATGRGSLGGDEGDRDAAGDWPPALSCSAWRMTRITYQVTVGPVWPRLGLAAEGQARATAVLELAGVEAPPHAECLLGQHVKGQHRS